eukprot:jgi/Tetstr1/420732/TSEL_001068.t1
MLRFVPFAVSQALRRSNQQPPADRGRKVLRRNQQSCVSHNSSNIRSCWRIWLWLSMRGLRAKSCETMSGRGPHPQQWSGEPCDCRRACPSGVTPDANQLLPSTVAPAGAQRSAIRRVQAAVTPSSASASGADEGGSGLGDWLAEDPEAAALAGLATEQAEGAGANGAAVPAAAVTATATATAPPTEGFTKLFVSNIGWTTEPEDIHAHFSSCGEVVDVGLPIMPDGRSKGFAFVEFADPAAAAVAVATLAGIELDGRELVVEAAGAPKTDRRSKAPGGTRVFVQRLSYDTTWETLKDFFKQAGDVTYASVSERPDGSSKGCGIVQFQTAEEAQ